MYIGRCSLATNVVLAPMAGITDRPSRMLARRFGAALAVTEMVASERRLWASAKSRARLDLGAEPAPRAVQVAGAEPRSIADAARAAVDLGADLVDVNMGCPAKKVCRRAAGSALLADPALVGRILAATVAAVEVPVTVKIRSGPHPGDRNGVCIARIAEDAGVAAITVHGRTRACAFRGPSEQHTARAIKRAVAIPVIINGDIDSPSGALAALAYTAADAVMIGRAARGNPWLLRDIVAALGGAAPPPPPRAGEVATVLDEHLAGIHALYGEPHGVRVARKHIGWYAAPWPGAARLWERVQGVDSARLQRRICRDHFAGLEDFALERAA